MSDHSLALQKTIFYALDGDSTLQSLVTDVFDFVPDIITCAKGLTSGYIPMGAMIISDSLINNISILTSISEKYSRNNDNLISIIGGPETPAAGFGSGIERVMLSMDEDFFEIDYFPQLTIIPLSSKAWIKTNMLSNKLRERNIAIVNSPSNKSFKSQMRYANQIKSKYLMVVGNNELDNNEIELKELSSGLVTKLKFDLEEIYSKLIENG